MFIAHDEYQALKHDYLIIEEERFYVMDELIKQERDILIVQEGISKCCKLPIKKI